MRIPSGAVPLRNASVSHAPRKVADVTLLDVDTRTHKNALHRGSVFMLRFIAGICGTKTRGLVGP